MKEFMNGVEIYDINGRKAGDIFFNGDDLLISTGGVPINLKSISEDMVEQLGTFFFFLGKNAEAAATRIDFKEIYIYVDGTNIHFIWNRRPYVFESIGPSEMKKIGNWLKKSKARNRI